MLFSNKYDKLSNFYNNYEILQTDEDKKKIARKVDDLIYKVNNEYSLNDNNKAKSEYNQIIKDIYNNNENLIKNNHRKYFDNMISIADLKQYLHEIID